MMKRVAVVVACIALWLVLAEGSTRTCRAAPPPAIRTAVLAHAGLPTITYGFDGAGRLVDIRVDETSIATYEWNASLPTVRFAHWQIDNDIISGTGTVQQTARGANGRIIRSTGAGSNDALLSRPPVLLDAVAAERHLPAQWQLGLHADTDAIELDLGQNRSLKFHMRTISPGQRVGVEDGTGTPLFWDVDLPVNIPSQFQSAVLTRLVVTASGGAELAVDRAAHGAVDALWITRPSGQTTYSLRFIQSANATAPVAQAITGRGVHAEMMAQCGNTTTFTCWDYSGGSYCDEESWPVYCDGSCGCEPPPTDPGTGGSPVIAPTVSVASVDTTDPANPMIAIDVQASSSSYPPQIVLLIVNGVTTDSSAWYGNSRYLFHFPAIGSFGDGTISVAGRACASSNACGQDTKWMTRYTGSPLVTSTTLSASWQEADPEGPVTHSASYGHSFRQSYTTTTFSGGIETGQTSHFQLHAALATINGDPTPTWNANATAHASSSSTYFLWPSDNPVECSSGCTSRGTDFGMFGYSASVDEQITSFVVDSQGTFFSGGALSLTMQ